MPRIEVTAKDNAMGIPGDPECCPVALAFKRACPGYEDVYVDGMEIEAWRDGDRVEFVMPMEARTFVAAFDRGDPVEPFTFEAEEAH